MDDTRLSTERLRELAFLTMEHWADVRTYHPVVAEHAMGFVLAWLYAHSNADRLLFERFWGEARKPIEHYNNLYDAVARQRREGMQVSLNLIYEAMDVDREPIATRYLAWRERRDDPAAKSDLQARNYIRKMMQEYAQWKRTRPRR